jgi:hypothetical protein
MAVPLDDRMSRALQAALELSASISGVNQAARERLAAAFEADARAIEMVARILASASGSWPNPPESARNHGYRAVNTQAKCPANYELRRARLQ